MGVLYQKGYNIVIKVVAIFPLMKIMNYTVPIIDKDGFTVDGYHTWQPTQLYRTIGRE